MSEPISIDDLDAPQFSSEGQAVLARYAANAPKAFTMDAMLKSAEERLDVKLFRDEYMLDNLDRFNQEGEENGPFTEAGRTLHFESSVTLIIAYGTARLWKIYPRQRTAQSRNRHLYRVGAAGSIEYSSKS